MTGSGGFEFPGLGDHICSIYRSKDEQMTVIVSFIEEGLKRNEKCLYVVNESTKEEIIVELEGGLGGKFDIKALIDSGQLVLLTKDETYLKDGYFDPDRMIRLLKDAEKQAIDEGYAGLRATGEMTWISTNLPGVERLIEYEAKLGYFFPKGRCVAICQYNEKKFDPKILVGVLYTHPKLILYGKLVENPFYIPPDILLQNLNDFISRELYKILKKEILGEKAGKGRVDYLYSILRSIPSAIFMLDLERRITLWNSAAETITGLKSEDVIGRRCTDVLRSPECQEKCSLFESDAGKPVTDRCRISSNSNGTKWILKTVDLLRDLDGRIIGGIEAFQDITDRVEMEEKLKKSEERYRELWNHANDIFYIHDLKGTFIDVNEMALRTFGLSKEDLGRLNIADIVDPEYLWLVIEKIQEIFKKKRAIEAFELLCRTREGRKIWVEVRPRPLFKEGEVVAIQGVARDITERKRVEEKLRKSEAKYKDLFENSLDIITITNLRGEFVDVNKAFERVLGYSRNEVIGKNFMSVVGSKEIADLIFEKYNQAFREGKDLYGLESEILTANGKRIFLEGNVRLIKEGEKVVAFQGNFRDITDRKNLERSLSELNDILRLLNKILRHDIINDLSAIRAAIEFSLETGEKELLEKVLERIDRSVNLIRQMRELEELTRFRELKPVRIRDVLEEVSKKYEIKLDIEGDGVVEANEALVSVFDNLIGNAIKHGKASKVFIRVKENDLCEIRIADDGRGIPTEIRDSVFEEGFSYGDARGSGLGLYISKRIVEAYGGNIEVGNGNGGDGESGGWCEGECEDEGEKKRSKGAVFVIKLRRATL